MVRAIERIEQDIKALEAEISAIAIQLHSNYTRYFTALGAAVRQQLILATYHLCTQAYPEAFLALSLGQRQSLQQSIRQIGSDTAAKFMQYTKTDREVSENSDVNPENNPDETGVEASILESLSAAIVEAIGSADQSLGNNRDDAEKSGLPTIKIANISQINEVEDIDFDGELTGDNSLDEDENGEEENQNQLDSSQEKQKKVIDNLRRQFRQARKIVIPGHLLRVLPFPSESTNPTDLLKWQQSIEFATQQTIKKTSHEANLTLQKAGILSKKIPEPILNVANSASDSATEVIPGPPNLLNLVIEMDEEQKGEESQFTPITIINLRLAEIEFADSSLSHERKNIRNITMQLQKLKRDYQNKLRERSIAEAEAAWRASWYEDR
ncbi:hypothetical protein [Calothrix sp. NIES-3974]|uniref:hypothetical protein n=1 Tax=Calothrix sp. NIES-3974 TaxID=2005462 RepID=UPI000B600AAD|nr:hypothetical protein [Calothrix sp. NIES-3974]BAZ06916.1 hypothetical protein NIES3974_35780 [Calothrix sp. NIES-3974]